MAPEARNVLFIGLTQMGKSSLLKSILQYGGHNELADTIVAGGGDESQTQEVTSYNRRIKIQNHFLEHEDSGERIEPDAETDGDDYHNTSEETTEAILLNMIDTPGMSDSQGGKASVFASGRLNTAGGALSNIVDEQHKMRVLLHLNKLSTLHAVIFVVKFAQSYSDSFQRILKGYFQLFDVSSINLAFHVAHTGVTPDKIFSGVVKERETDFVKIFKKQATHHFLENCPSKRNSVAIYQSRQSFANFLRSLSRSTPVTLSNLRYPKGEAIVQAEHELVQTYECIANSLEAEIKEQNRLVEEHTREKSRFGAKKSTYQDKIKEITYQIDRLNTDTLIEVDEPIVDEPRYKYKDWSLSDRKPYVRWNILCKFPIAKVTKDSSSCGFWELEKLDGKVYQVDRQAYRFEHASGTITIMCKKRDIEADKISSLRSQKRAEESNVKHCDELMDSFASKITDAIGVRKSKQTRLEELKSDRRRLTDTQSSILVRDNNSMLAHLATGSILCMAKVYNLEFDFSISILPTSKKNDREERNKLDEEGARQTTLIDLRVDVSSSIQQQYLDNRQLTFALEKLLIRCNAKLSEVQENITKVNEIPGTTRSTPREPEALNAIYARSNQRTSNAIEHFRKLVDKESAYFQRASELIQDSKQRTFVLLDEDQALKVKWDRSQAENRIAIDAAVKAKSLVFDYWPNIGYLTVLRKASADGDEYRYMTLYDEIAEVMKADALDLATSQSK